MKEERLKKILDGYHKKGIIKHDLVVNQFSSGYLEKTYHDLETAKLLLTISDKSELKTKLNISPDFIAYDWVINMCYYSMYHAATSALSAIGLLCSNHSATIYALEYHYVHKLALLDETMIEMILRVKKLEELYIENLLEAKRIRQSAQYAVGPELGEKEAKGLVKDASLFVERMDELVNEIKKHKLQ